LAWRSRLTIMRFVKTTKSKAAAAASVGAGLADRKRIELLTALQLREFLQAREQAYVLRVASNFTLTLAAGTSSPARRPPSGYWPGASSPVRSVERI
jgi:hypothetical protein